MKKIYLSLSVVFLMVTTSFAQFTTSGNNISYTAGNVTIGSSSLWSAFKFGVQGMYGLGSPDQSGAGGILQGDQYGFGYFSNLYGDGFFHVQDNGAGGGHIYIGDYVGDVNMTYMHLDDESGKIFMNSYGGFSFNYGASSCAFGSANGTNLNYGTSYYSFNANRDGFTGNWAVTGDGFHNGGGVMYNSIINGEIYFAPVESTGTTSKTLSDLDIKSRIAFRITQTAAYAKQVYVQTTGWPDYVFKKDYSLRPLSEVSRYIKQNQHLPDMPAAATVEKDGINLGEMNKALLKKVEELTLYLIEKDKEIKDQQQVAQSQEEKLKKLSEQIDAITRQIAAKNK